MTFEQEWTRCGPWLQAALDEAPTTHTLDDVKATVIEGGAQFWPFDQSACVTEFLTSPRAKVLNHWLCGGDLNDLLSHRAEVETFARQSGCNRLLLGGRKGWGRVLSPHGFAVAGMIFSKELL